MGGNEVVIFYMLMGCLFTYLAISSGEPVLSFWTLLPAAIATYDFSMAIRLMRLKSIIKKDDQTKT